jgi:hypothetical protein
MSAMPPRSHPSLKTNGPLPSEKQRPKDESEDDDRR